MNQEEDLELRALGNQTKFAAVAQTKEVDLLILEVHEEDLLSLEEEDLRRRRSSSLGK